jgi:hypothetical protein
MRFAYACALALVAAGCGGNGLSTGAGDLATAPIPDLSTGPDFAVGPDLTPAAGPEDMSIPPDLTQVEPLPDSGISCGNMSCALGQKCCVLVKGMQVMPSCMDSCPDGDVTLACDGPENCDGNPCCINIKNGGFTGGAMCNTKPTDCAPAIDIQTQSGMDRFCHTDNDCTSGLPGGSMLPLCCTISLTGSSAHVCLNKLFAGFIKATCP